jgi:hypothetical protein
VLGSPATRAPCCAASAGRVAGVDLVDVRSVVITASPPRRDLDDLHVVRATQAPLADTGVACPRPTVPPVRSEGVTASVDGLVGDPGMGVLDPADVPRSAGGLTPVARTPWAGDARRCSGPIRWIDGANGAETAAPPG